MQACRIAAEDIACRRGDRVLLRGVSFALARGDALRLRGANGIGKSSLLRIAAGLLAPYGGRIDRAGAVGLVDERPALDPHLPLARALSFWGAIDNGQVPLAELGLQHLGEVPVRYLSTGQRKRAAFARLLGQDAPLWLLDEPLNGLDDAGVTLIESLIARHRAAGGIALVASHQDIALPGAASIDLAEHTA
jgi:heme exporter protein A